MKAAIIAGLFGFGAALAVVIGSTMTADTMAVVLGVAVGVAASVPVSLVIVWLVRRMQDAPGAPSHRVRVYEATVLQITDGKDGNR